MLPFGILMALLCATAFGDDLFPDLTQVKGIEYYDGPESGKALLRKNGFVVVPRFYRQIFSPYAESRLAHFVTADAVHRTFHVIFEDALKEMEASLAKEVAKISQEMVRLIRASHGETESRGLAEAYFEVPAMLLMESAEAKTDAQKRAAKELELIDAVGGVALSPLFGYPVDYSQFKPRGFYVETPLLRRYFKAMTWFGHAAFRLESEPETRAAMLIADVFRQSEDVRVTWRKIDRLYSHFLSPCDDLTPEEYAGILDSLAAAGQAGDRVKAFQEKALRLRDPKINSMVLTPEEMGDWVRHSKGMRFLGKRYIPDSEAFTELTDPKVPGRGFPTGLDLMAANGSARARELMALSPDSKMRGYAEGMEKATASMEKLKAETAPSHYVEFLKVAEALTGPPVEQAADFAKTTAYADKGLSTTLAAWVSMRHSWALHTEESVCTFGGAEEGESLPGYVEPKPAFFTALRRLVAKTHELLKLLPGLNLERLGEFDKLLITLTGLVEKELAGKPFSEDEIRLLEGFGYRVAELQGFETSELSLDSFWGWMGLIADVHSEMLSERCLEVGTGAAMPIYVIIERRGNRQLLVGAVYSYYEFQQPIQERLTDSEWQETLEKGKAPAVPAWTASFVAPYDVDSLIERLRQGEEVEAILSVNDPKIDAFLEKAVRPNGELVGKDNYRWAFELAAARLGHKMVPQLMETLTGRIREEATGSIPDLAEFAAEALPAVMEEKDLLALLRIAVVDDAKRAGLAIRVGKALQGKLRERFLTQVILRTGDNERRQTCLEACRDEGGVSKDITPHLLGLWKEGDTKLREGVLEVLRAVWTPEPSGQPAPPPCQASESELRGWKQQIRALALETIDKAENYDLKVGAMCLAARLRIAEAVPLIARIPRGESDPMVCDTLAQIGTDEALDILLRFPGEAPLREKSELAWAWAKKAKPDRVVGHLRKCLSDNSLTGDKKSRVCDRAAEALAIVLPDGPGFNILDKASDRDAKIEAWKDYTKRYVPE